MGGSGLDVCIGKTQGNAGSKPNPPSKEGKDDMFFNGVLDRVECCKRCSGPPQMEIALFSRPGMQSVPR